MRLTLRQLGVYLGHIPVILAKEAMTASLVASMPYMEEESRLEVLHDWAIIAGTEPPEAGERISFEDFKQTDMQQRIT